MPQFTKAVESKQVAQQDAERARFVVMKADQVMHPPQSLPLPFYRALFGDLITVSDSCAFPQAPDCGQRPIVGGVMAITIGD